MVARRVLTSEFPWQTSSEECSRLEPQAASPARDPGSPLGLVEVRADPDALDSEVRRRHDLVVILNAKLLHAFDGEFDIPGRDDHVVVLPYPLEPPIPGPESSELRLPGAGEAD